MNPFVSRCPIRAGAPPPKLGKKGRFIFPEGGGKFPPMCKGIPMGMIFAVTATALRLATAHGETALDAVKELPKDQAARIARIEGRDGAPAPDRWYILTQDPAADNGLHEFVVSKGEVVASRALSQFAESLTAQDMLGAAPVKIDSDQAAKLAHDYAEKNGAAVAAVNYELKKDGPDAAPEWTISCLDEKGNKVGEVVVTAAKGDVVSHQGFALDPEPADTPEPTPRRKPHFETYAKPEVAVPAAGASPADREAARGHPDRSPAKPVSPIGQTLNNVGRTLHKYLPF